MYIYQVYAMLSGRSWDRALVSPLACFTSKQPTNNVLRTPGLFLWVFLPACELVAAPSGSLRLGLAP
jgi:hypothetical protein